MEVISSDPYELKLFQMFQSCDTERSGLLDVEALRRLCALLELRDKGAVLIAGLAPPGTAIAAVGSASVVGGDGKQSPTPRVDFERFKEALLNFLGTELDGSATTATTTHTKTKLSAEEAGAASERSLIICDDHDESSDREVSPKLVVGTKKYGRRSRPQTQAIQNDQTESEDSDKSDGIGADEESGGHRSCHVTLNCCNKKLVQRSTSQTDIPGGGRRRRPLTAYNGGSKLKRCSSLPAQRNMQSLAKMATSNASHSQCNSRPIFLTTNKSTQASQDNSTATQLHSSIESLGCANLMQRMPLHHEFCGGIATSTGSAFVFGVGSEAGLHLSALVKDTPTQLETLPSHSIIELWESASIANGKGILLALGFHEDEVNLSQLSKVLEDELRSLDDEQQTTLLRASLALQSAELSAMRLTFRQLHAENAKLRSDNKDANRRIAVQAVEIDERHAALEESSKNEIRQLEQKHAVIVRDLTALMANDREQWSLHTGQLEARLKTIEQEDSKIKNDMEIMRTDSVELELEQQKLQKQITDLLEQNIQLNNEIADLAESSTRSDDGHRPRRNSQEDDKMPTSSEMMLLTEKVCTLQEENTNLRDKNDELVAEMENLNLELTRAKVKSRKANASNSALVSEADEEFVEAGAGAMAAATTMTTATKRRGDSPSKTRNIEEEESPLRLGKLRKCATANENGDDNSDTSGEWMALNSELQHSEKASTSTPKEDTITAALKRQITELKDQLQQSTSRDAKNATAEERCKELEASLEQMQRAYEDCEDYWQSKLSEERQLAEKERQIYDEEQQENDKKFTELMEKVREYEEQYSKDGRLSPIVEKDTLEEQYADLEAELETTQCDAEEKAKTIEALQSEVMELREILTGAKELNDDAEKRNSIAAVADTQSSASSPISYLWHQSTIQEPAKDYQKLDAPSTSLTSMVTEATGATAASKHNRNNLSTSETTIFSTAPVETTASPHSSQSTISPIKKPGRPKSVDGDVADCETSSTGSGKSFETHSVASTTPSVQQRLQTATTTNTQNPTKTYSSAENSCSSPSGIKEELKRLKFFEISLKEQIKDLSLQRDGIVMELQQLHEARPVLEKAYARTTHPTLIQRVNQLELKNRHLQNVIKQQQQYTEGLMNRSWHQHKIELGDLHSRIEAQGIMLAEQVQRLQNADILVKDLYVENSHLTATVQRLEQQRARVNMMHQQQQQQQHLQHQQQQRQHSLNGLPGLP